MMRKGEIKNGGIKNTIHGDAESGCGTVDPEIHCRRGLYSLQIGKKKKGVTTLIMSGISLIFFTVYTIVALMAIFNE